MPSRATVRSGLLGIVVCAAVPIVACGADRRVVGAASPSSSARTVSPLDSSAADAGLEDGGASVPEDEWRVVQYEKFRDDQPGATEYWEKLEHRWDEPCGPGRVHASRRLCLSKGKYVFESRSSDHVDVKVDGASVIAPRVELARTLGNEPHELSRPLLVDGCVLVEADMPNRGCFPSSRLDVRVRPALEVGTCDFSLAPKGEWHACVFAGRNREELLSRETWKELVSPWKLGEGPKGWEETFSVVAKTTACFEPGRYVMHVQVAPGRMKVVMDERALFEPSTELRGQRHVVDSDPMELSGCHALKAAYVALDRDTRFEVRFAKVGSPEQRTWAEEARACDPPCRADARCVDGKPFGVERKDARVCQPTKGRASLGEACDPARPCSEPEVTCCRDRDCDPHVRGICTYHDR